MMNSPMTRGKYNLHFITEFVIAGEIPEAGKQTNEPLKCKSDTTCDIFNHASPQIQQVDSCNANDKIYCIEHAPD